MSVGITALKRKTKEVYRVAFSFRGVECRELLALPHTRANETYCTRLRAEIQGKIERGTFIYSEYFPESSRCAVFGHGGPSKTTTIREALLAYKARAERTLEPSTYAAYRKAIDNVLIPWCGDMQISSIKPADIREWVGLQTVTLKRIRNVLLPLRNVLNDAVADEVIIVNPLDRVDLAKLVPVDKRTSDFEPEPYTESEVQTLLAKLPVPERHAFQVWAYTGLRTGELIGLRWASVDLDASRIHIHQTTTERKDKTRTKTRAGDRKVPLLPAASQAIEQQRQHTQPDDDRVFTNPRSTRLDKAWDDKRLAGIWKRAHVGTGIAYRNPYQLRHTFASNLLSQGENPAYIAKLLGHKTVEMVMRHYGRWVDAGEVLGFDRPPRQYGMKRLWDDVAPKT